MILTTHYTFPCIDSILISMLVDITALLTHIKFNTAHIRLLLLESSGFTSFIFLDIFVIFIIYIEILLIEILIFSFMVNFRLTLIGIISRAVERREVNTTIFIIILNYILLFFINLYWMRLKFLWERLLPWFGKIIW